MEIPRIQRRRLYQEISGHLEKMIIDRTLKQGDLLPAERDLMAQFGVGRPAVREALLSLQKAGLVTVSNGERARVTAPTAAHFFAELSTPARMYLSTQDGMRNFQNTRRMMELAVVRHAAAYASAEHIGRIGDALERNRRAMSDPEQFEKTDVAFHYEIVRVAENPILDGMHSAALAWLSEQRRISLKSKEAEAAAFAYHERIFEAIRSHDRDRAESEMDEHLHSVENFYWNQGQKS